MTILSNILAPSPLITEAGTQTLLNKTLTSPVINTPTLSGGTINNAVIGGSTAAAGTFTNLAYTGTLTGGTGIINIGSGQVYKDASGNLGIGTSLPSTKLDVRGSGTITSFVGTTDTSGGSIARVRVSYAGGGGGANSAVDLRAGDNYTYLLTQSNTPLLFGTNNTERMRIDSSGNLGLGVTALGDARLAVYPGGTSGVVSARFASNTTDGLAYIQLVSGVDSSELGSIFASSTYLLTAAKSGSYLGYVIGGTERARIDASGNLLVGTTSTSGATSNNAMIVGGLLKTLSGSVSAASGSATTLYAAPSLANGTYIVSVGIGFTGEPAAYSAVSLISVDNTVIQATALKTATGMTISVSGQNVRATQVSGVTANIVWTATRVH